MTEILEEQTPTFTLYATMRTHGMPVGVSYPCVVTELATNDKSDPRYAIVDMRDDVSYGDLKIVEENGKPVYQKIGIWTTERRDGHRVVKEYGEGGKYCKEPLTQIESFDDYEVLSRREWDTQGNFVSGWSFKKSVEQRTDAFGNIMDVKQTKSDKVDADGRMVSGTTNEVMTYPWIDDKGNLFDVRESSTATYDANAGELTRKTRFDRTKTTLKASATALKLIL